MEFSHTLGVGWQNGSRGTIPLGETRGVHLLAANLLMQGVVLAQMRVAEKAMRSPRRLNSCVRWICAGWW